MKRFVLRLLNVIRPRRGDEELTREVTSHLALIEDEHRRRGLTPDEARLAARRAMGSVALVHDTHRDARSFRWMDDLRRDIRHAGRRLRKAPGFAATAILTLGLGIAVNNTFFTIVNAICLRGLPIEAPERVLVLGTRDPQGRNGNLSFAEFDALRSAQRSFTDVAAYINAPVTIADEGRAADRLMGAHISAGGFDLLGEVPILGRGFRPEEDRAGAPAVVVIGASVWKTRYAADPGIIGRTVAVNGTPVNVIGVMPDGFRFLQNTELWQPLGTMPGVSSQRRDLRTLFVFGRLAPRVSAEQAVAEVEALGEVWSRDFPESNRTIRTRSVPINEAMNRWFARAGNGDREPETGGHILRDARPTGSTDSCRAPRHHCLGTVGEDRGCSADHSTAARWRQSRSGRLRATPVVTLCGRDDHGSCGRGAGRPGARPPRRASSYGSEPPALPRHAPSAGDGRVGMEWTNG